VIKAIIFDVGNVIVACDYERAFASLGQYSVISKDEIPRLIFSTGLYRRFESGSISSREFFTEVSTLLKLNICFEEFCNIWSNIFLPAPLISEELIATLATKYRLLVLSDNNPIHFPEVRKRYVLLRHFHDFVLSYKIGAVKPSAKIFQAAIRRSGCNPSECFFVDDVLANVKGARRCGIQAMLFISQKRLEEELHAQHVL